MDVVDFIKVLEKLPPEAPIYTYNAVGWLCRPSVVIRPVHVDESEAPFPVPPIGTPIAVIC